MKFLKDILTEDLKDKKYSSKKVMGVIAGLLSFVAFVVDGFHWYDINDAMFDSMLIFSATMLGVSVLRKFAPGVKK
tara:strand:+ start:5425 stop:5652 length:228 start_codon:yes stop_codon:yes gene_type:complete